MSACGGAEFEAERRAVDGALVRLERMQARTGDARRMLTEAFETVAAALGGTPLADRMQRHAALVGRPFPPPPP